MQKRRILAPCALLASLGIALSGCASATPRSGPAAAKVSTSATPGTPDLLKMITDLAAKNGDSSLTNIQYVSTNAGQAASSVYGDPSVAAVVQCKRARLRRRSIGQFHRQQRQAALGI